MGPKFLIFYSLILLQQKAYSALTIQECPDGIKNVAEDSEISLTCDQYDRKIEWYYSSDNTLGAYIGYCDGTYCNPADRNQFRLHAERSLGSYKSTLDITRVTRDEARFFRCKNSYTNDIASCRLRVTAPAEVVSENCSVVISDWQVQGECLVEKMYSSDDLDIYKCTWNANNTQVTGVFQRPLRSYESDGRTYIRGVCSFRHEIPVNDYRSNRSISYTYKISVDPGPQNKPVATITIEPPKKPEINCEATVLEGSTVICMCTSQYKGNPPAKFVWDGTNTDGLLLLNVSRQQSFTNYTCRQTWGPYGVVNTAVNYTFTVAYGPSVVDIFIVTSETLICTAMDVSPSAMFHWNITCDKRTDTRNTSTCTLPARDTDGDIVVQCTASNTAFPHLSVTKIFVRDYPSTKTKIYTSGTEQSTTQANEQNAQSMDSPSSDTNNGGLIGGVVAAVILAIIVGVVIVVIIVKRRKDPMYETARRPDNNEHNYEDLTQNRCEVRQPTDAVFVIPRTPRTAHIS